MGNSFGCLQVDQSTIVVKEHFGKFDDVMQRGCHCVPWCFGYHASKLNMAAEAESNSIEVSGMQFGYDSQTPLFFNFSLKVLPESWCLLLGANGPGKTTLLRILAGKYMVDGRDVVRVLKFSAFHDTNLVCDGHLAYLGESWSKNVGCAGGIPLQGNFSAEHMIFGVEGVDPIRREKLIELLDIDLRWRMHKVSDGQRRRVQICLGLLHTYKVLLLDEVTVARMDLLDFFKEDCEQIGATVVYATHYFFYERLKAIVIHVQFLATILTQV